MLQSTTETKMEAYKGLDTLKSGFCPRGGMSAGSSAMLADIGCHVQGNGWR